MLVTMRILGLTLIPILLAVTLILMVTLGLQNSYVTDQRWFWKEVAVVGIVYAAYAVAAVTWRRSLLSKVVVVTIQLVMFLLLSIFYFGHCC